MGEVGPMEREMNTDLPWGLLLVTDAGATDEIPGWNSDEQIVTASETALVVRTRHAQEGAVVVRLRASFHEVRGDSVFEGFLRITSGTLRVGSASGESFIDVVVEPGLHRVCVFVTPLEEAEAVDLLIDP